MLDLTRENISEYLLKHNIRPSYARIKIFEYLVSKRSHPTVDEIYKELSREIPTLSKTTVYNTLNTMMDVGIVKLLTIEENEARYDADISEHGHFKCEKCNSIYDFYVDFEKLESKDLVQFRVNDKNLFYKGICSECLNNI